VVPFQSDGIHVQGNAHIEFEDQSPDFITQVVVGLQELDFGSDKLTAKKVVRCFGSIYFYI
jgi:hypothetical protein